MNFIIRFKKNLYLFSVLIVLSFNYCVKSNLVLTAEKADLRNSDLSKVSRVVLEGKYNYKNIYFKNPSINHCYCAYKVTLNGSILLDSTDLMKNAVEIDLKNQNLSKGDPVKIVIHNYPDCYIDVLNPEVR